MPDDRLWSISCFDRPEADHATFDHLGKAVAGNYDPISQEDDLDCAPAVESTTLADVKLPLDQQQIKAVLVEAAAWDEPDQVPKWERIRARRWHETEARIRRQAIAEPLRP
jgi:hypothetical protein